MKKSEIKEYLELPEIPEVINAVITSNYLGFEDHRILTISLSLETSRGMYGFGGYALSYTEDKFITSNGYTGWWILKLLQTIGVDSWGDIMRQHIRVCIYKNRVVAIGHFLKDDWFVPEQIEDIIEQV